MSMESGFYPPGAEFDPRAPWNQDDEEVEPDEVDQEDEDDDGGDGRTPERVLDSTYLESQRAVLRLQYTQAIDDTTRKAMIARLSRVSLSDIEDEVRTWLYDVEVDPDDLTSPFLAVRVSTTVEVIQVGDPE